MNDFDFAQLRRDAQTELATNTPPREAMLAEVRESLRGLREGLYLYSEIMDPQRTALHRQTLDELTHRWKEYASDNIGLYEIEDVIDLLVDTRMSNAVQGSVFERYSRGEIKAHADQAKQKPKVGWVAWLGLIVFFLGAMTGSTFWIVTGILLLLAWLGVRLLLFMEHNRQS